MPTDDPISLATEILDGRPSPEALEWLRSGFRLWLSGSPMTAALGLDGRHSRGPRYAIKRRIQLQALRDAASTIPASTTWARSKLLAAEIRSFQRKRHRPPRNDLERALAKAFEFGDPPTTTSGVHAVLSSFNGPHPSD